MVGIQAVGTLPLLANNLWVCDCDLQWVFGKLEHLWEAGWHLHVANLGYLTCVQSVRLVGAVLSSMGPGSGQDSYCAGYHGHPAGHRGCRCGHGGVKVQAVSPEELGSPLER